MESFFHIQCRNFHFHIFAFTVVDEWGVQDLMKCWLESQESIMKMNVIWGYRLLWCICHMEIVFWGVSLLWYISWVFHKQVHLIHNIWVSTNFTSFQCSNYNEPYFHWGTEGVLGEEWSSSEASTVPTSLHLLSSTHLHAVTPPSWLRNRYDLEYVYNLVSGLLK